MNELDAGLVYGPNYAFTIEAPPGWILENAQGVSAFVYPAGGSATSSPLIAYVVVQRHSSSGFHAHIRADLARAVHGARSARVERRRSLRTRDRREAIVYQVQGIPGRRPEWVAYIDAPSVVIVVAVFASGHRPRSSADTLLARLVRSIAWITDRVRDARAGLEQKGIERR